MFDKELVLSILLQIDDALGKVATRAGRIRSASDFTDSPSGMETLDSVCMLFMAIGEALKNLDKITDGTLLSQHPEIDWKGAIGFRDIIAHHYFDIDAEQVLWICAHELGPLSATIKKLIEEMR
jgi:uncharacterized protein with HEPN domain